jgi:hypothetical protein
MYPFHTINEKNTVYNFFKQKITKDTKNKIRKTKVVESTCNIGKLMKWSDWT